MPIYAYRCGDCGFEKDVLQKFSDAPLSECPQCHKPAFARMVTAPNFQLKGTGWYVTDFRGGKDGAKGGGKAGEGKADSPGNGGNGGDGAGGGSGGEAPRSTDAGSGAAAATSQASKPAGTDAPKVS